MDLKKISICIGVAAFLAIPLFAENLDDDPIFPTPVILKSNVAFWMKIYTEVPMSEGLLHDRDYPMVIFDHVSGDGNSRSVKERKKRITDALIAISSTPESAWTDVERGIVSLYKKEADSTVLAGAADRVRFQQGQRDRFREGLVRSGMFLDTIRAILKAYNVPLRLAYLPHVESSFNTEAYSKVGAAGLWQFMRGTGKLYNMRIDYTIDERRDPVTATTAAAKYLSSSYGVLGTWPLAITSYNHGVYGMKRAVAETGSRDLAVIIKNYKSRSFQFASSNFYGCFLAASYIAENHERFFPGVNLERPLTYNDFVISHYIGADDFCTHVGVSQSQLMHLNPAIRPSAFSRHQQLPRGYALHIPASRTIAQITAAYNAIPDSLKVSAPPRPAYYRVNRGDNLYAIATRLGVSVQELALENDITRMSRIRAGQVLRVPAKPGSGKVAEVAAAAITAPVQPPATSDTGGQKRGSVTAMAAEPLVSEAAVEIAMAEEKATMAPEDAASIDNGKKSTASLIVPRGKKPAAAAAPAEIAAAPGISDSLREIAFAPAIIEGAKTASERPHVASNFDVSNYDLDAVLSSGGTSAKIIVSVDETIGHYADWLDIPTWRIRKLNDMGRASSIRINRPLLIPIDRPDALEQFAAARLEYHMAIEEDFYTQFTVSDILATTLKRGETLWDLCNNSENPLPMWLLKKYNQHLDLGTLPAGSEVWIPQVRELSDAEQAAAGTAVPTRLPLPTPIYRQKMHEAKLVP